MDFLDFNLGDEQAGATSAAPIQPALLLPLGNLELLLKKLQLGRFIPDILVEPQSPATLEPQPADEVSQKYAQLSLKLIASAAAQKPDDNPAKPAQTANKTTLTTRLSRVLTPLVPDLVIRDVFAQLPPDMVQNLTRIRGLMARRRFRGKIETDVIRAQAAVLREYAPVVAQLQRLGNRLDELNEVHQATKTTLARHGSDQSLEFTADIQRLSHEKKMVATKRDLLANFRKLFTLNEYEEWLLGQGDLNEPDFFPALAKAHQIIDRCSLLLAMDNALLGQKIMASLGAVVDRATARILAFTHKTLENYQYAPPGALESVQKCLAYFRTEPALWEKVVRQFSDTRLKQLVDDFYAQAQGGRAALGSSRPIYLSAHDPVRYIGDLLAYIHAVVVNEHELVYLVFKGGAAADITHRKSVTEAENPEQADDEADPALDAIVEAILTPLAKPLVSKIAGILSQETTLATANSIFGLVDLYAMMLAKVALEDSSMVAAVRGLVEQTQNKLVTILRNRLATIRQLLAAKLELNLDLQPPEWVVEYYQDILPIVDASPTPTLWNLAPEKHAEVLELIVNQPIDICFKHVDENPIFASASDSLILKANFIDVVLSKTMPIVLLGDKVVEVSDQQHQLLAKLTECQFNALLHACGAYDFYNVMCMICPVDDEFFDAAIYQPITENKLFTVAGVKDMDARLQEWLPTALLEIQRLLLRLNLPLSVTDVIDRLAVKFCLFYRRFAAVTREYLQEDMTWTDTQVATLLGVESAYDELVNTLEE